MTAKSKRRWFQIHLSTCLIMMVTAGLFLWTNTRVQAFVSSENSTAYGCLGHEDIIRWQAGYMLGWPFEYTFKIKSISHAVYRNGYYLPEQSKGEVNPSAPAVDFLQFWELEASGDEDFSRTALAVNIGIGLFLLLIECVCLELATRYFQKLHSLLRLNRL